MKSLQDIADRSFLSLADLVKLEESILASGYMTHEKTRSELEWFLTELGIDEYYFKSTRIEDVAQHLIAISASELVSRFGGAGVGLQLIHEQEKQAGYIVEEEPSKTEEIENRIEKNYPLYRIESYLTSKKSGHSFLRFYIVSEPRFTGEGKQSGRDAFEAVADRTFLERSLPETIERYRRAWEALNERVVPYISVSEKEESAETRIMIGVQSVRVENFLTNFSRLFDQYGLHTKRKYREITADNRKFYSLYFDRIEPGVISDFVWELNGVLLLPDHQLTRLFQNGLFSPHSTLYALAAASFTNQFITAMTEEYAILNRALKDQPEARGILENLKLALVKDTFSEDRIAQTVFRHHDLVSRLYANFGDRLHPKRHREDLKKEVEELKYRIEKLVPSLQDRCILYFFLFFNKSVLKTNFFLKEKRCLSFKLDPAVLPVTDYPETPFGLFFFVGKEFLGFHMRFRDIARGGIRIVTSRHHTEYKHNLNTIFSENYNLASTQQKKNKDIPEGGAKGTLLLHQKNQQEDREAFISYIDSLLDLITPEEDVLDREGRKDILFLGPDERTAELMNWAALYARKRRYLYWKAFTTGKALELGGIPHDLYGMTTNSVHEYVLGVLAKLGLKEEEMVKIQTGGPDGDLGSNEILISKDKTVAVVDGSGVLYDPAGLERRELKRLAKKRVPAEQFKRELLSGEGFFVSVNDTEITLPNGTFVPNGEEFRNSFHLNPLARADLFVPCGGRPAAVNINNWRQLFDERGKPRFRIIIEGANLFITEDARLRLEEQGVIVIKDASTNKGGVTSSSLEVYASLAMNDEEYEAHLVVRDDKPSEFRGQYVREILEVVRANARAEFKVLWQEHETRGAPFTELTNRLSRKINDITDAVVRSDLPGRPAIREKVIREYTPPALLALVGLPAILQRVPASYLDAIIATSIATRFVYTRGLETTEVDFYNYIEELVGA
jgi:glutamate dehydrogenase